MDLNKIVVLILFLLPILVAEVPQTNIPTLRSVPWELTVLAAIILSLTLIALGFMLSKAFGVKELSAWANNELYQIIVLSFIVFLIFGILKIESIVFEAYNLSSPNSANPAIENAKNYLYSVRSYLTFIMGGLISEKMIFTGGKIATSMGVSSLPDLSNFISKFVSVFSVVSIDIGGVIDVFFDPITKIIDLAISGFGVIYALNSMQIYFLEFVENVAFVFILPFGLFFRIFNFSRKVANLLIVLAISLYIVFPLTYLLNQNMVDAVLNEGLSGDKSWRDILGARMDKQTGVEGCTIGDMFSGKFLECLQKSSKNIITASFSTATYIFNFVFIIFTEAAFAFILFTLIPIIDFTITVVIARELGSLLGSDVSFGDLIKYL
ncbi:MAG: hypothetical protein QXO35_00195 [Candidatus Micrarchaeia archaeon]